MADVQKQFVIHVNCFCGFLLSTIDMILTIFFNS